MRFSLFLCRRPRPVSVHITTIVVGDITRALTPTGGSMGVGGSGTKIIPTPSLISLYNYNLLNKISVMQSVAVQNNLDIAVVLFEHRI